MQHFVRIGLWGHVGRFTSSDATRYPRGCRVVCRTARGLEVGEVLSSAAEMIDAADGAVLRRLTVEDELLLDRLAKHRDAAYAACTRLLTERQASAILVDVEHLFDGASLFFYFLGEVTPELDAITGELAAAYDTQVQFQKFAETLATGCGPGCGTAEAAGQGCAEGGCSTCAMLKVCH